MATVPNSKLQKGFYIEVGCPGCGGELEIDSDLFVTSCRHCGSPLRLVLPETPPAFLLPNKLSLYEARIKIDRQLKSQGRALTGSSMQFKQIYYPYWKVEGMLLRCRNRKEEIIAPIDDGGQEEVMDLKKSSQVNLSPYCHTIAAAVPLDGVPDSMGIRSQSLKMVPFKSTELEDEVDILEISRPPEEVIKTVELSVARMNTIELAEFGENLTKIYNPETSLIFFPYSIAEDYEREGYRRYVLDGLTGRILFSQDSRNGQSNSSLEQESTESIKEIRIELPMGAEQTFGSPIKFGAVEVQFHRCGHCGEDLPARASCIYICGNCHELTCLDKNVSSLPRILSVKSGSKDSLFFPFWSFQTNRGKYFGSLNETDRILIPAFNIPNFEALYRLTCRVTSAAPKLNFEATESSEISIEQFAPVDIFPSTGVVLAKVVFYRYELEKNQRLANADLGLNTENLALCFISFKPENYFFVDSALKSISFEKRLVMR